MKKLFKLLEKFYKLAAPMNQYTVNDLNDRIRKAGLFQGNNKYFTFNNFIPSSKVKSFQDLKQILFDTLKIEFFVLDQEHLNECRQMFEESEDKFIAKIPVKRVVELSINKEDVESNKSVVYKKTPYTLILHFERQPGNLFKVWAKYAEA